MPLVPLYNAFDLNVIVLRASSVAAQTQCSAVIDTDQRCLCASPTTNASGRKCVLFRHDQRVD